MAVQPEPETSQTLPASMRAMVLDWPGEPLKYKTVPVPEPAPGQVLIKVSACGVCRTDLHILDGELDKPKLPLIMGHEIVGTVVSTGPNVTMVKKGDIVGVPWLGYTCGRCSYCLKGKENLCENAAFTGYTLDGGYAEYTVADERYCFKLSGEVTPATAPLLCAGLIGYRSYSMIGEHVEKLGIYGFGAAAHILIQVAVFEGKKVYAFTRKGDVEAQAFARSLGAVWAGDSSQPAPQPLDAAIIFAPVGALVPKALQDVDKGGVVVCGGIHMSDIPAFPYRILWEERVLRSVANLTRGDGARFLPLAAQVPVQTEVQLYPLLQANEALEDLRQGRVRGAAVLVP
ncbi:propanol-preferring alcohol dehydrogenase [Pontibacter mucosus]|uniref:Propanol-preferring alcohol dehydrogenase n=1 Tax=Pontibacter mucosus TaxID=1649266 RepID=A0A2T5YCL8_9BACT|nr:zinc-dependent alcohol dehydrogenase family protein [Pontibacter mucosus]PTX14224.1 propanol-preferring alcohol dehydrogenase [Pontibacter mucosus]